MATPQFSGVPEPAADDVLFGWKEIADYLHTVERNAQRWEKERQLPVHGKRPRWARRSELDAWLASPNNPRNDPVIPATRKPRVILRRLALYGGVAAGALILLLIAFARPRPAPAHANHNVRPIALTTNAPEAPIHTAAISPDGQMLAYCEESRVYLRPTAEAAAHIVEAPLALCLDLSWFPDGKRLLVAGFAAASEVAGLWEIPVSGNESRLVRLDAEAGRVAPNGTRIAFITGDGHGVGVMALGGEPTTIIVRAAGDDTFNELAWTADGAWLLLGQLHLGAFALNVKIESIRPSGGAVHELVSSASLRTMCAGPAGRVVYAQSAQHEEDVELWDFTINGLTGERAATPRQIGYGPDWSSIYSLSMSRDGRFVTFIRGPYEADVHLGVVADSGRRLERSARLTPDDRDDLPTAFTPDGRKVVFQSNRSGNWSIYAQDLDSRQPAQLLTVGPDDYRGGRVTPDGQWLIFFERAKGRRWSWQPPSLKAVRLSGGPLISLLEPKITYINARCARSPSDLCVLSERDPLDAARGNVVLYALRVPGGRGRELARTFVGRSLQQPLWDVSPDGSQVALIVESKPGTWAVRILSLTGKASRELPLRGRTGLQSIDWAADGHGWYISSRSGRGAQLLYVDAESAVVTSLRRQPGSFGSWGVPSPDGRLLAFLEWRSTGNVWMLAVERAPAPEGQ